MTFAQRRSRLTTHFSERIPVVNRRMTVLLKVNKQLQYKRKPDRPPYAITAFTLMDLLWANRTGEKKVYVTPSLIV